MQQVSATTTVVARSMIASAATMAALLAPAQPSFNCRDGNLRRTVANCHACWANPKTHCVHHVAATVVTADSHTLKVKVLNIYLYLDMVHMTEAVQLSPVPAAELFCSLL